MSKQKKKEKKAYAIEKDLIYAKPDDRYYPGEAKGYYRIQINTGEEETTGAIQSEIDSDNSEQNMKTYCHKIDIGTYVFCPLDSSGRIVQPSGINIAIDEDGCINANYVDTDTREEEFCEDVQEFHGKVVVSIPDEVEYFSLKDNGQMSERSCSADTWEGTTIRIGEDAKLIPESAFAVKTVQRKPQKPALFPVCSNLEPEYSVEHCECADGQSIAGGIAANTEENAEAVSCSAGIKLCYEEPPVTDVNSTKTVRKWKPRDLLPGAMKEADYMDLLLDEFDFACYDQNMFVYQDGVYMLVTPDLVGELLGQVLDTSDLRDFKVEQRKGIAVRLRLMFRKKVRELTIPRDKLLFDNGMVDLNTMCLLPPDLSFYFPVRVRAKILKQQVPTPVWDQFLCDVSQNDEQVIIRIKETTAYALFSGKPAKAFFVLADASNSGKSTYLSWLARLFGIENVSHVPVHNFGNTFEVGETCESVLNISGDEAGEPLKNSAAANLKSLTGDDYFQYDRKYKTPVSRRAITKFYIATNYSFTDAEHSDAVSDRRIIVPFLYTMPRSKRNMNLQEDLWKERDEIVTSLIPYARRLWSNDFNFSYCQKADQLAAKWDGAERSIEYFLRTYYRCTHCSKDRVSTATLRVEYQAFCKYMKILSASDKLLIATAKEYFGVEGFHSYERGVKGIARREDVPFDFPVLYTQADESDGMTEESVVELNV